MPIVLALLLKSRNTNNRKNCKDSRKKRHKCNHSTKERARSIMLHILSSIGLEGILAIKYKSQLLNTQSNRTLRSTVDTMGSR